MAMTEVYNIKNEKVGDIELNDSLFGVQVNPHLLHDVVRMQRANRRSGNSCTKTRTEVSGSGTKPWRQKGTGRARSGSKRSPLWRGGGVVFGPKPRDYSYKLSKKVRRLGVRMALSSRFEDKLLTVLDNFKLDDLEGLKLGEWNELYAIIIFYRNSLICWGIFPKAGIKIKKIMKFQCLSALKNYHSAYVFCAVIASKI